MKSCMLDHNQEISHKQVKYKYMREAPISASLVLEVYIEVQLCRERLKYLGVAAWVYRPLLPLWRDMQ